MEIGIGLPVTVPGFDGPAVADWARRAEESGFASLGALDRLVYDNGDALTALSVAAGATTTIRLATTVLVAGYHGSPPLLAKRLATLDRLSGGRLVVGLGAGGRADDFAATGAPYDDRGRRSEAIVTALRAGWTASGPGTVGPAPAQPEIPIVLGGRADAVFDRVGRLAQGWIGAGGGPRLFAGFAERVRESWAAHGRTGEPRLMSIGYFCLGPGARAAADAHLTDYYSFLGAPAAFVAASALTDAAAVAEAAHGYAEAGCDELILFPCRSDLDQVGALASVLADLTLG
ncbi:LLM class flavin-dependent oxidoreductase [Actinokineospora sp. NBRC 105648]|uniref:LLM class flavin-dependent oxidoreductase n=1 Tax=Actinokineospora sp. NBRC 105648 TaxID=3032206 RepID=UPI0024A3E90B|nr:LLM class flavin-dependent oxidoreductase [Actinokineospora sp. NBRC 105648]GLZ42042.1 monooxygenase [Actinokineospora sp. NBRC 105648]